MGLRERSKSSGWNSYGGAEKSFDGGLTWSDSPTGASPDGTRSHFKSMMDHTSRPPYPDQPLLAFDYYAEPCRLSGEDKITYTGIKHRYSGRSYLYQMDPYPYAPAPETLFYAGELFTAALANMNPSTSALDLPLFLFEFKDFPSMLRNLGEILAKRITPRTSTDAFLAYKFGWAPLISDLKKLLNIQKLIDNRLKYLKKYSGDGGRVSRQLHRGTVTHPGGVFPFHETAIWQTIQISLEDKETFTSWFCADLKINIELPKTLDEQQALAARAAFGLYSPASTLWNAIPWSFLIDYFSNIGDFLEATTGLIPFSSSRVCVMQKSIRTRTLRMVAPVNGVSCSTGKQVVTRRDRAVSPIAIPLVLPRAFLTGSQLANIAGLVTSAALKGSP